MRRNQFHQISIYSLVRTTLHLDLDNMWTCGVCLMMAYVFGYVLVKDFGDSHRSKFSTCDCKYFMGLKWLRGQWLNMNLRIYGQLTIYVFLRRATQCQDPDSSQIGSEEISSIGAKSLISQCKFSGRKAGSLVSSWKILLPHLICKSWWHRNFFD